MILENKFKMKNPTVSVIMPVYNAELYLAESIESTLNQTFSDFEFIIINDGSTDNSESIINSYSDERIKVICREHDFITSLNIGIEKSTGKYIARMDADDIMLPDRLSTQIAFLEEHPEITVCGSFAEQFGLHSGTITVERDHNQILSAMFLANPLVNSTVIIKKSALGNTRYVNSFPYAEDYKLWIDLAYQGLKFTNLPEVLLLYRTSPKQVTVQNWQKMIGSASRIKLEFSEKIIDHVLMNRPTLLNKYNSLVEQTNNGYLTKGQFILEIQKMYIEYLLNKKEEEDMLISS